MLPHDALRSGRNWCERRRSGAALANRMRKWSASVCPAPCELDAGNRTTSAELGADDDRAARRELDVSSAAASPRGHASAGAATEPNRVRSSERAAKHRTRTP